MNNDISDGDFIEMAIHSKDHLQTLRQLCKENAALALRNMLSNLNNFEKEHLLCFGTSSKGAKRRKYSQSILQEECPILFDVVITRKFACLDVLLQNGFTLNVTDCNGWNILHYLIVISHFDQSFETKAVNIWRDLVKCNTVDTTLVRRILMKEDVEGLRPLELAMHLGCMLLFDEMIQTQGVYLAEKRQSGYWEHLSFDITEYEKCGCVKNRRHRNLPLIACYIDRRILSNAKCVSVLMHGMLCKWVRAKLIINLVPTLIWFVLRLFVFTSFYIIISGNLPLALKWESRLHLLRSYLYGLNFTNVSTKEGLEASVFAVFSDNKTYSDADRNIFLEFKNSLCLPVDWYGIFNKEHLYDFCLVVACLYSVIALVYDVIEMMVYFKAGWYRWRYAFNQRKTLLVSDMYYRSCQFIFSALILLWGVGYIVSPNSWYTEYGIILTCYVSVWTVLYFLQMLPSIGQFVSSIQKMLFIMAQFLVVYFFIMVPYPHAFQVLLTNDTVCNVDGFGGVGEATYTTFKIMLNMVDFSAYGEVNFGAVHLLHIIYVFTVAILLVNFLIALLSTSVGETVEAGDVIMMLQRLSVVTTVERRVSFVFPSTSTQNGLQV